MTNKDPKTSLEKEIKRLNATVKLILDANKKHLELHHSQMDDITGLTEINNFLFMTIKELRAKESLPPNN